MSIYPLGIYLEAGEDLPIGSAVTVRNNLKLYRNNFELSELVVFVVTTNLILKGKFIHLSPDTPGVFWGSLQRLVLSHLGYRKDDFMANITYQGIGQYSAPSMVGDNNLASGYFENFRADTTPLSFIGDELEPLLKKKGVRYTVGTERLADHLPGSRGVKTRDGEIRVSTDPVVGCMYVEVLHNGGRARDILEALRKALNTPGLTALL